MSTSLRFRQVHLDFHTSPAIPGIGADFDPEAFAATLEKARVNSITCFARCHHGHLYFPSTVHPERIHPNLARPNLLGEQIDACHKRGIRVPIYITVQWDQFSAEHHPEWLCVDENGTEYGTKPFTPGFYRNLDVFHPGYRQFLFDHVKEVLDTLPVDGLFFDIVQPRFSTAPRWIAAIDAAGLNPESDVDRRTFALRVIREWEQEMSAFVRERNPDATIFYNSGHVGPRHRPNADAYSHFELESLPSGGWGYLHFPQAMRYGRTLGPDCLGMTGKFHTTWGDFGSYKNPEALQFECFQMLALGAKCSVGDQLPPRGQLDGPTYDLIGGVYAEVEKKEPWCVGARPVCDVAVLTPESFVERQGYNVDAERRQGAILGAVRMLQELRVQFDIVDTEAEWMRYRLLILPDDIPLTPRLEARLDAFIASGGGVIASHKAGIGDHDGDFASVLGIKKIGDAPFSPDFIVPGDEIGAGLPKNPHVMYQRGMEVEPVVGAEVLARTQVPYFNRTWRHFCSHNHTPSSGEPGYPAAVLYGTVVYFAHPVFTQYHANAPRWVKQIVGDAVKLLLPKPILEIDGPTTLLTSLNRQEDEGRHVLHLLHFIPERRGQAFDIIEDVIPVHDIKVRLRLPSGATSVKLVPSGDALEFSQENGVVAFTVPVVHGHQMVEIA